MLATQMNMERLQDAEQQLLDVRRQRVQSLRSLKRRRKRAAFLRRKNGSAVPEVREIVSEHRAQCDEIQSEIDRHLRSINDFRRLFAQQIEDTTTSGFTELSGEWAERFLSLETPFEEEPGKTTEQVRRPYTIERKAVAFVWRNIRAGIRKAIEGGEKVAPAFAHHMQSFEHEVQNKLFPPRTKAVGFAS